MKRKLQRLLGYSIIISLIVILIIATAACSQETTTTATQATLVSITVKPPFPSYLALGFTQQFLAVGKYSNSLTKDITSQVTWTSSDVNIASISSSGLATSAAVGNTTIIASLSGITSPAVTLTVVTPTLSSITVTPASPANLSVGSTQQFNATANYSDNSVNDITPQVTWTSSDNTVASISSSGLAAGVAVGHVNITASFSGLTSPIVSITVVPP